MCAKLSKKIVNYYSKYVGINFTSESKVLKNLLNMKKPILYKLKKDGHVNIFLIGGMGTGKTICAKIIMTMFLKHKVEAFYPHDLIFKCPTCHTSNDRVQRLLDYKKFGKKNRINLFDDLTQLFIFGAISDRYKRTLISNIKSVTGKNSINIFVLQYMRSNYYMIKRNDIVIHTSVAPYDDSRKFEYEIKLGTHFFDL